MTTEPQLITEAMYVHEEWYTEARKQTLETLPEFLRHLLEDYGHDYGTICHALAAGAVATAYAMDRSPQGGITGFQGGAVMWQFIKGWEQEDGPMRLIRYQDMLYPQHERKLGELLIDEHTWTWLRQEAAKKLIDVAYGEAQGEQFYACDEASCSRTREMGPHRHGYYLHNAHPRVIAHWESIVRGEIPFGYGVGRV